jgi:hypothetical protein
MRKALRILLLPVLCIGVISSCACSPRTDWSPEQKRAAEKVTVETAVEALMQENGLTDLSQYGDGTPTGAPVRTYEAGEATNDMTVFPSTVWKISGYLRSSTTSEYYYTVENDGTVRQFANAAKTVEYVYHKRQLTPEEQRAMEKVTVAKGVRALMMIEGLADLSKYADGMPTGSPVRTYDSGEATNDMTIFPSTVWHIYGVTGEGETTPYFTLLTTEYYYTVENDGTVRQFGDAAKTVEYNAE